MGPKKATNKPKNTTKSPLPSPKFTPQQTPQQTPHQASQELSPPVVSLNKKFSMSQEEMAKHIKALQDEITNLNKRVSSLETKLTMADSHIAIVTQTSNLLRQDVDRLEQYSRRSCIVMARVPAKENDTPPDHHNNVTSILQTNSPEAINLLDKTHPIGPVVDGKQTMILRFNKHSTVKKLYNKRKQFTNGVTFRPSITKQRTNILRNCNDEISTAGSIFNKNLKFTFADIEGNLKVCLKQPLRGRDVHTFRDKDHIYELLQQQEIEDLLKTPKRDKDNNNNNTIRPNQLTINEEE